MADKCIVRDGLFVEPCVDLDQNSEIGNPPPGKQRGIYEWRLFNTETHKPTRRFFGVKTSHRPKGMLFNFCPWCGERIDAPFVKDEQP
jgi:hypothetical protein